MVQRLQHRRFATAAAGWAPALKPGEVAVNSVRRELAIGDTDGTARLVLAIRLYSSASQYVIGDYALQAGVIYKANANIAVPEAFNGAKWDKAAFIKSELDGFYAALVHNHDAAYAAIGHNHDAAYAALVHNHDAAYAAIGHNHDAAYAAIGHLHTGTYLRLTGLDVISGTQTFTGSPSIVATGAVSVGAGSSPAAKHHVKDSVAGEVASMVENAGAGPAFYRFKTSARAGWFGLQGGAAGWSLFDDTGGVGRFAVDQGMTIGAPTGGDKGTGTLNAAAGVYDNNARLATQAYADGLITAIAAFLGLKKFQGDSANAVSIQASGMAGSTPRYVLFAGHVSPLGGGGPYILAIRGLRADGTVLTTVPLATTVSAGQTVVFYGFIAPAFNGAPKQIRVWTQKDGASPEELNAGTAGPTDTLDQVQALFTGSNALGNVAALAIT